MVARAIEHVYALGGRVPSLILARVPDSPNRCRRAPARRRRISVALGLSHHREGIRKRGTGSGRRKVTNIGSRPAYPLAGNEAVPGPAGERCQLGRRPPVLGDDDLTRCRPRDQAVPIGLKCRDVDAVHRIMMTHLTADASLRGGRCRVSGRCLATARDPRTGDRACAVGRTLLVVARRCAKLGAMRSITGSLHGLVRVPYPDDGGSVARPPVEMTELRQRAPGRR